VGFTGGVPRWGGLDRLIVRVGRLVATVGEHLELLGGCHGFNNGLAFFPGW